MVILYILGGIIAFILLVLCVPLEAEVKYRDELEFRVRWFFIPIDIYPREEKPQKPKNKAAVWIGDKYGRAKKWIKKTVGKLKKPKPQPAQSSGKKKKKKSSFAELREQRGFAGMLELLWRVVRLATGAFYGILRGIIVTKFDFEVSVCGEDAADTAVKYGELCSVLFPATAAILGACRRYKRNIVIEPDFSGGATEADIHIIFRAFPILAAGHATRAMLRLLWSEISDKIKEKMNEASREAAKSNI